MTAGKYGKNVWSVMQTVLGVGAIAVVVSIYVSMYKGYEPPGDPPSDLPEEFMPPSPRADEASHDGIRRRVGTAMAMHRKVLQNGDDAAIRALHVPALRDALTAAQVTRMRAAAKALWDKPFGQVIIEIPPDAPPYAKIFAKGEDRLVVRLIEHEDVWLAATPWFAP